ncbi:ATP-binding protein [Clostridioides difficile]|uniref:sensor histidine kinase n=1 Tax=unclassified Clostridioides TaxID=2635829 RepID=UPI0006BBA3E0|nr:histidine kinase [Clostridioides difficile]MCI9977425.1 GHKL domain-containing protein [Clostridioides difficile]MDB3084050.1 ATP-binding protein [Clostridioides difficile]NJI79526.1 GHKL domain-containing protein [Clostridioides difficile]NJJ35450.1 GHKL domain-containing protein [Clostridioides difficile]
MNSYSLLNNGTTFIIVLINIYIAFFLYKLTSYFIDFRNHWIFKVILIFGYSIISQMIIWASDPVNILFTLLGYMIMLIICSKSRLIPIVSIIMILYPIIVGINFLFINNPLYRELICSSEYLLILSIVKIVSAIIKLLFWFFIHMFLKNRLVNIKQYLSNKIWIFIDMVCIASFLSILIAIILPPTNLIPMGSKNNIILGDSYGTYIIILSAIIANIGVILLLQPLIENVKMKIENQANHIKEKYYNLLENQQIQIRKIRHDMNNHFQMIESYLEVEDIDGAKEYFNQLKIGLGTLSGKQFCKNQALNSILNLRHTKLEENGVDVHFNIDIDNHLGIEPIDLCTIFSNSLDNAIEASLKISDLSNRKVVLKARCEKEYFSYLLTNNKVNPINKKHELFVSDKKDSNSHGYGIENIRGIVDKYNGELNISYTDNEFSLFLYIRLF